MNTTFTSNGNNRLGKVTSHISNRDFSERSGCGGYALLVVLIIVAVALFTVVIPALS